MCLANQKAFVICTRVTSLHSCYTFCTRVTEELHSFLSQSELSNFFVYIISHVIPRGACHAEAASFAWRSDILRQYLGVVLDCTPNVFCWLHKPFSHPAKNFYLADGVHINPARQYYLYRSYRGAILTA